MPLDRIIDFVLERSTTSETTGFSQIAVITTFTEVATLFTVPARGATVNFNVLDSSWIDFQEYINVTSVGLFQVVGKNGLELQCLYLDRSYNTHTGEMAKAGLQVTPGSYLDSFTPTPTAWYRMTGHTLNGITIPYNTVQVTVAANPGQFQWVSVWGATTTDNATSAVVDFQGSIIVVGTNGGANTLRKYGANGNLIWEKTFGGNNAHPQAVRVDSVGNIYMAGYAFGLFFAGNGVPGIGNGPEKCIVVKYDTNGNALWANAPAVPDLNQAFGHDLVVHEATNSVWVVGSAGGSANFGAGPVTSLADQSVMIFKMNATTGALTGVGNLFGQGFSGGGAQHIAYGITMDSTGGFVVCGKFFSSATDSGISFGNGLPLMRHNETQAGTNGFMVRFNSSFQAQWQRKFGEDFREDICFKVDMNTVTQEIFVCGNYRNTMDLGNGVIIPHTPPSGEVFWSDAFAAKVDGNGLAIWGKGYGGSFSTHDFGRLCKVCNNGDVVIGGRMSGSCNFGAGVHPVGAADAWILRLDSNGLFKWVRTYGAASSDDALGATVDASDNVIVTGTWLAGGPYGTLDFGDGVQRSSTFSGTLPTTDACLVKYSA